jgi:hypothetical protein
MDVAVMTNNVTYAETLLQGANVTYAMTLVDMFKDMQLLTAATGIIQHASEGWSSFSSVPAMAKGIPILSTFKRGGHRYEFFGKYGEIPDEFFNCSRMKHFFHSVLDQEEKRDLR